MFTPAWSTPSSSAGAVKPSSASSREDGRSSGRGASRNGRVVQAQAEEATPSSSTNSSIEHLPLHDPDAQPCSPSILLNPLPPGSGSPPKSTSKTSALLSKLGVGGSGGDDSAEGGERPDSAPRIVGANGRRPSIVAQMVSVEAEPPAHFLEENSSYIVRSPPRGEFGSRSSSATGLRTPRGDAGGSDRSPGSLPARAGDGSLEDLGGAAFARRTTSCSREAKLRFAELPPGRRMYRSNSLSIGVAARAKMISAQGGGGGGSRPNVHQARYAGPQQWYQPGAQMPGDVYTYRDVQKGITKLWGKVRKRSGSNASSSATSTSSAEAKSMEAEAKGKSKEIEHIEEADENAINEDEVEEEDEDEEEHISREEVEDEPRGRSLGLDLGPREGSIGSGSTIGTEDVPKTPEDGDHLELSRLEIGPKAFSREQKGKGPARDPGRTVGP